MVNSEMKILSGTANPALTQTICSHLGIPVSAAMITRFPDGELNIKVQDDVRGTDLFIVQPTCCPQNEMLMELLMLIDCASRASAGRITAVVPYYGYARKDRKDEGRVPITAKLVANMLVTAGADRVLVMDLHAPQIQGFFDIPVDHLFAKPVFLKRLKQMDLGDLVCASPDIGSMKMAINYAHVLGTPVASCHKQRITSETVKITAVVGDVEDKNVLIVDDLIASGGSIATAAEYLKEAGARNIYVCATHPVLCGNAISLLDDAPISKVFVADTIPLPDSGVPEKFEVVSVAPFIAEAIKRIHMNMSVSYLFRDTEPQ